MKLAEKFDEDRSSQVLNQVIDILIQTSEKCDAHLLLQSDCKQFLQLASQEETKGVQAVEELLDKAAQIKEADGFDILKQILAIKNKGTIDRAGAGAGGMTDRSIRSHGDFKW